MTGLRAVSLFAGIGGIDLGLAQAGIPTVAAVEKDKAAAALYARRFPGTHLFDDVKDVTGDDLRRAGFVPERGVLAGGFPCQDLSTAGRRAGLAGARSGLFWEVVRLLDDLHPRWVIIENVPGLLTSQHGRDMGTVLGTLGDLGYGFAYRVLDAQWFGLAQRRKRVFIVGRSGADGWRQAAQVLLVPESGGGHLDAGWSQGTATAGHVARGADTSRTIAATLNSAGNSGGFRTEPGEHLVVVGGGG